MVLTPLETTVTIAAVALGAMLTRFIPFLLFPDNRQTPGYVLFLGKTLPAAMMGLLVVFCLKSVSWISPPYGLPELISIACIVLLQLWRRNVLLSIGIGTALYMALVQMVF